MKHPLLLLLLVAVAGCRMEAKQKPFVHEFYDEMDTPQGKHVCPPVEAVVTNWREPGNERSVRVGEDTAFVVRGQNADCFVEVSAYEDGVVRVKIGEPKAAARLDSLRVQSDRADAQAMRDLGIAPKDAATKVAAVMAANDITLPQVAAYLNTYGYDVVSRVNTLRPHWKAAPQGTYPIAYYVVNMRVAVGDTMLPIYVPTAVGPVWMRVVAYDGFGNSGPWSETTVSGAGAILPGVGE